MHSVRVLLALTVAFAAASSSAHAAIYDEALRGDLSNSPTAPTLLTFEPGANIVRGIMGGDPGDGIPLDPDFFTFTLPPLHQLTSIRVDTYTPQGRSFYAISGANFITVENTGGTANHLSNCLVDGTGEYLPRLSAGAEFGGLGLPNPVPSGTYTVWFQEVASVTTYQFTYTVNVIPEPSAMALLAIPALSTVRRRRA
jgi:hypothetical protein